MRVFSILLVAVFSPLVLADCKISESIKYKGTVSNGDLNEISGIAISQQYPNIMWAHNDSGAGPIIYGLSLSGKSHGSFKVKNVIPMDWEDIAYGPCPKTQEKCLYIGDIGDNKLERDFITIYIIKEPSPQIGSDITEVELLDEIKIKLPTGPKNFESLAIHSKSRILYLISKGDAVADLKYPGENGVSYLFSYKLDQEFENKSIREASLIGKMDFNGVEGTSNTYDWTKWVTGADIDSINNRLLLLTYGLSFELDLPQPISDETTTNTATDNIKTLDLKNVNIIQIPNQPQVEAIAYGIDAKSFYLVSEFSFQPIYQILCR